MNGVTLEVKAGEVLGFAGLVGGGKSRIWRSVIGINQVESGTIHLKGCDITHASTEELIENGIYYLPPYRKNEGLQLTASSRKNLNVSVLNCPETVGLIGLRSPSKQKKLVESGKAVIIVSSDLPEVINLSHRVFVFSNGVISAELKGNDINEENILKHFF